MIKLLIFIQKENMRYKMQCNNYILYLISQQNNMYYCKLNLILTYYRYNIIFYRY